MSARAKPSGTVVGITGAPGSGKSETASVFADLGAKVVALDAAGHALLADPRVRQELRQLFGGGIFEPDGGVSREALARRVFDDPEMLSALNLVMHPRMVRRVRDEVVAWRADASPTKPPAFVVDGALLIEMGLDGLCDRVLVVSAPREARLARLASARGWTEAELARRERPQLDEGTRRARADTTVENGAEIDDLRSKATQLWKEWT
jgi:dephospho-CoA kinase